MTTMEKKVSQTTKILRLLKSKRTVTNVELNRICFRYTARIHELRKDGYNIQRQYEKPGVFKYWLVQENEQPDTY